MKVTCFLPCRQGSERVPRKNIRPFAGYQHGLVELKLRQLLAAAEIDQIVLSTNDTAILAYAETLRSPRLRIHERQGSLSSSTTSTDELVGHALDLIPEGNILWTHVTSPFVNSGDYDTIVNRFREGLGQGYDSLMTTSPIQGFLWSDQGPINYDRNVEKWPRTQTLKPVHEVNSAAFLAPAKLYRELDDRIGKRPLLYPLGKIQATDIDWEDDFAVAQCIAQAGLAAL